MKLSAVIAVIRSDAEDWAADKSWLWRLPILCYLTYAAIRHLKDPEYNSLLGGITFGIHELGHLFFSFDGTVLMVAAGTLCQLVAPFAAAIIFLRQRDYFGISFAGCWLSFGFFNVATYAADARTQKLPLLGFSPDPIHDWNYMLGALDLLSYDLIIARFFRVFAFLLLVTSISFGAWLCWMMKRTART